MANIMVTGGTGLIGSYIVRALADKGDNIIAIVHITPYTGFRQWLTEPVKDRIQTVRGDVLNLPEMLSIIKEHDISKIVHFAVGGRGPYMTFKLGLEATINVLEAARLMDIKRVVYASSRAAYGIPSPDKLAVEDTLPRPWIWGAYGSAKLASEYFGKVYDNTYNMTFIAGRISGAYGAGMREHMGGTKTIIENAVNGISTRIETGGDFKRDYIYVKDIASFVSLALDVERAKLTHRVFNVSLGQTQSVSELVEIVTEVVPGAKIEVGPGIPPQQKRYASLVLTRMPNERARKELGWEPKYDLRRGVTDYINMYRSFLSVKK